MWGPLRANHPGGAGPGQLGGGGVSLLRGRVQELPMLPPHESRCHTGKGKGARLTLHATCKDWPRTLTDQGLGPDEGAASLHGSLGLLQPVFGALLGCLHKLLHLENRSERVRRCGRPHDAT